MTPDRLKTLAEARWGFGWQSALARDKGYNIRTIQRWFSGEWVMPGDLEAELMAELAAHRDRITALITHNIQEGKEDV